MDATKALLLSFCAYLNGPQSRTEMLELLARIWNPAKHGPMPLSKEDSVELFRLRLLAIASGKTLD